MKDYTIFLISNDTSKYNPIQQSILPEMLCYFDGTGYPSFSKLVNDCVASCRTETVIIASDKVMPNQSHVQKTLHLLDRGYGMVALYRYAFFGFRKELFRQIGMFDERFQGGGFEDYDMTVRLIESNIAMYVTEEVPYSPGQSKWNYGAAYPHWTTKWKHHWKPELGAIPEALERTMPEEDYGHDLGPKKGTKFLTCFENSYVCGSIHVEPFFRMKIPQRTPNV